MTLLIQEKVANDPIHATNVLKIIFMLENVVHNHVHAGRGDSGPYSHRKT